MAKPTEIEGISAGTPFAEAAAVVLEARAEQLLEHADRVLDTDDVAGVHDMRVAARRLRTALEVFEPCFPRGGQKRMLKEVKALGDALGERRDRDVAVLTLGEFAESIPRPDRPGIASLIEHYEAERVEANRGLKPAVARRRLAKLRKRAFALAADARAAAGPLGEEERR